MILFGGTVLVFANSSLRTSIQAVGDTLSPLYVFGLANVLNAVLNPSSSSRAAWGSGGPALATVIATGLSFLAINAVLVRRLYAGKLSLFLASLGGPAWGWGGGSSGSAAGPACSRWRGPSPAC